MWRQRTGIDGSFDQQPVSIVIKPDWSSYQMYMSGRRIKSCKSNIDHGVLAVGYSTDSGNDYWKVKNSWCANTMVRGTETAHHGGVLYSDTNPV